MPSILEVTADMSEKQSLLIGQGAGQSETPPAKQSELGEVKDNELFREVGDESQRPWWKANFLLTERVKFGTWDGVFTSCMLNIFGTVVFLRAGWLVGNAGILLALLISCLTAFMALLTVLSAVGVCERCRIDSGGVYFLLSHVLGGRLGAAVGIVYCLGQAVGASLYCAGLGESVAALFGQQQQQEQQEQQQQWLAKAVATGVTLLLLVINGAGVKWVVRLQLLLLGLLLLSVGDFLLGSFVARPPQVTGYSAETLANNTLAEFTDSQSFFSVFGVFFPTVTGVLAGINMSGDLSEPRRNIPVGTLAAVGSSWCLYSLFVLVLGATCTRASLQFDYAIGQRVALLGPLFLCGLYVSSLSAALGGLSGASRVLAAIAYDTKLPVVQHLATLKFKAQVPLYSLICIACVTLVFVLVGSVNTLATIVTMPFLLTYATVSYAYFALAMTFDLLASRERRLQPDAALLSAAAAADAAAAAGADEPAEPAAASGKQNDLDKLFPERLDSQHPAASCGSGGHDSSSNSNSASSGNHAALYEAGIDDGQHLRLQDVRKQPASWYSRLCNRWLSLLATCLSLLAMLAIMWPYALATLGLVGLLYLYIGHSCPGAFPGVATFSLLRWLRGLLARLCGQDTDPYEEIVVQQRAPGLSTHSSQVTQDSRDYADRGKYHHSQLLDSGHVPRDLE